ncbi:MAG: sigma-54-dependent Fis family transcriptional regulator [Burkholderiales bacterium PBB4]|nr:MAG: sigma-54-dependent Fis family transcriptional regulator [Burkholderiales bacterium PBB4]
MATHPHALPLPILVVDDEPDLRTLYELTLLREGYRVETAGSVQEAWQLLENQHFRVVITDMRLPDGLGLELIAGIKARQRAERCVVITAYGSADNAVESLKAGAFDYLTKPVDLKQFRAVIASATHDSTTPAAGLQTPLQAAHSPPMPRRHLAPATPDGAAALARLAGDSAVMRNVKERVTKVARSMAPILIHGESGTGKELVASALHANSHRNTGPWVAVNCSAIPENLLEAEFFGAKKGAYTGATQDREGFFQAAKGGTLFLDEIGDLPLAMQSKLLRAIQERCVRPLGSNQEESVDVRIISATHKDLPQEVQQGRFRQDLFYRLNVIDITIAPLRERPEDLPALCAALLSRIAFESGQATPPLSSHALEQLARHPLRGNVRELENLLHRAVALSDGDELQLDCGPSVAATTVPTAGQREVDTDFHATLPAPLTAAPVFAESAPAELLEIPTDLQTHLDQQERGILVKTLRDTGFNRTVAAQRLGLSLRQIRYRIARLKIDVPGTRDDGADE